MAWHKDKREARTLAHFLDRPLAFHRALVDIPVVVNGRRSKLGILGALMLSQAITWQQEAGNTWFQKTLEEWQQATAMDKDEMNKGRCRLRKTVFWKEREVNQPEPRLFVFVDLQALADVLDDLD